MVLDEATSALDAQAEAQVAGALASLDCAQLIIAHRLSTICSADRIIVLEDGSIVQNGTIAELLAADGQFKDILAASLDSLPK